MVQTLPPERRSRGVAIAYSGGSLGALITPILITPIASRWGWHGAFWFTGAMGLCGSAMWSVLSRREELRKAAPVVLSPQAASRWNEPALWAFVGGICAWRLSFRIRAVSGCDFFSASMHKSQVEIGHVLWIPPLGWEIGYFFWGWMIDRFAKGGAAIPCHAQNFPGLDAAQLCRSLYCRASIRLEARWRSCSWRCFCRRRSSSAQWRTSPVNIRRQRRIDRGPGRRSWSARGRGVMPMHREAVRSARFRKRAFEIAAD